MLIMYGLTRTRPLRAGLLIGAVLRTADFPRSERAPFRTPEGPHQLDSPSCGSEGNHSRACGRNWFAHGVSAVRRTALNS